jgi:Flp pilus assembly pilin Flp
MKRFFKKLAREESGQDVIEYVLVSTLLALSMLAVLRSYNIDIQGSLNGVAGTLTRSVSHQGDVN